MVIRQKSVDPFEYHTEGDKAVLLIHGFTGAPTEMAPLGEHLYKKGYSVSCPLLAGHGTTVEEMEKTTWKDWVSTAESELVKLQSKYDRVYVVGFSMGGCIALYLTMKHKVSGLVTISAPIFLIDKLAQYTPLLKFFRRYKPKPQKPDYGVPVFSYDKTPIRCVASLMKLINKVKSNLAKVDVPTLVVQGESDKVVDPSSGDYIYQQISSKHKEIKHFPKRSHMITVENGRHEIMEEVDQFLAGI